MQHTDEMNPFRAIIAMIVNMQVVVTTKRGVMMAEPSQMMPLGWR